MCGCIVHYACGDRCRTRGSEFHCASCLDDFARGHADDDARGDTGDDHELDDNGDDAPGELVYYEDTSYYPNPGACSDEESGHDLDDEGSGDDIDDGEPEHDDGDDDSTMTISGQDGRATAAVAWEWIIDLNRMQSENPPHSHEDLVAELRRLEHDAALARESQRRRERSAGTREGFGPFGPSTFPGEAGVTARDDRDDGDDGEAVNGDGVDEWLAVLES
jgi:hypothetical protein